MEKKIKTPLTRRRAFPIFMPVLGSTKTLVASPLGFFSGKDEGIGFLSFLEIRLNERLWVPM